MDVALLRSLVILTRKISEIKWRYIMTEWVSERIKSHELKTIIAKNCVVKEGKEMKM